MLNTRNNLRTNYAKQRKIKQVRSEVVNNTNLMELLKLQLIRMRNLIQ